VNPEDMMREFWRVWEHEGIERLHERYEEFFVADGAWRPPISRVSGGDYVGKDGFAQYVIDFRQAFVSFAGRILEVVEVAPDVYTTKTRVTATYLAGGSLDGLLYAVIRFREGRMAHVFGSYDPEEAAGELEAALREEATT
jgi:hypothetical protein